MIIPDLTPRFQLVPPERAREIRTTCARWGYSALAVTAMDAALLVYYATLPQASVFAGVFGGFSVLMLLMASVTMASCRNAVPNGYLNLHEARFARRFPWVMWVFSMPTTGVSLLVLWGSDHGRFGGGWSTLLYLLVVVAPFLVTTVVAVRCFTLFQAPYYYGPVPPRA
ncbi:hypothetical protein [Umezawaea sp. Da 62-37]|uniref:hypothetical protein n=1 Tax=Umezawaea sp. Da 62-37 TaxID=3075927 RepID=UPI0028F70C44|nr:hypothetical protein [Umezawaea sp. Da 62-37]WNV83085.1 hypothetical protein RM788_33510 [Umezawaea sp. Da 62-37]